MVDSNGGTSAEDSTYYDIENHMKSGSSWGSYFWFGGPGYQPPRWTLPLIPGEVVRIIIGGADGTLITIDASGHIHIIPQPGQTLTISSGAANAKDKNSREANESPAHPPNIARRRKPLERNTAHLQDNTHGCGQNGVGPNYRRQ
jgi:hypothetical protein